MKKAITIFCIFMFFYANKPLHAAVRVSAMSGNFYATATWVGGFYPAFGDDIVISAGHTVTLDAAASLRNITIESGATLVNGAFDLTILTTEVQNPIYTNNGIHNGPGNLIAYEYYNTEVTGTGVTNCNIVIVSYGLRVLSGCNLTINGNIQHSAITSWNMNGKYFIDNSAGGTLTVNGDLVTTTLYYVGIQNAYGTLNINGDIYLYGGSEFELGSNIENSSNLNVTGNLMLGDNFGYAWNHYGGVINIGGNLLGGGAGVTYFIQDANAIVRFGGDVFPAGYDGDLCVSAPGTASSVVEYNGSAAQVIKAPSDGAGAGLGYLLNTYCDLVINKPGTTSATPDSELFVDGVLTLTSGLLTLGNNNLTLNELAVISGTPSATNMVVATGAGKLQKVLTAPGSFTFPVGDQDGTAEYSPVTLEFTSGIFSSAIAGVNLVNTPHPGVTGNFLNRCWTVSQTGITAFNCNATFRYTTADVNGTEAVLSCTKVSPLPWTTYGLANTASHQLTATGVNSFSTFTGQKSADPTPINELANITTSNGTSACYDATQTLVVAGNGTTFSVENGGSVTMIAGQNIVYLPGASAYSGSFMHGYITLTGNYCDNPVNPVVNNPVQPDSVLSVSNGQINTSRIMVYPNPTSGIFSIEMKDESELEKSKVEIFNMQGGLVFNSVLYKNERNLISLSDQPVGLYLIRVISGSKTETARIIKR